MDLTDADGSDDKIVGVYGIRSSGGRTYVGSSADVQRRWYEHRNTLRKNRHHNQYLQNAWNKYGEGFFQFIVIEECRIGELIKREQHHIDSTPDRYNLSPTAGSQLGIVRSDETRARMSAAQQGRKMTDEHKANISASKKGNTNRVGTTHTPETKARISAAKKGRKMSDDARKNMSVARMGNKNALGHSPSPETRAKIGASMKGNQHGVGKSPSPETREKLSAANRGKVLSSEHRAKISASQKARWERKRSETAGDLPI